MSDQIPSPNQDQQLTLPPTTPATKLDPRDARRAEREARREERYAQRGSNNTAWIGGIILIVLGVVFLLQSMRGFYLNNWWALFILIPALGSFGDAWNIYRQQGRVSRRVRVAFISGCVLLLVTATFLFNWRWDVVLPVLLIVWGITLLLNNLLPE
jgi:hypothetical protein